MNRSIILIAHNLRSCHNVGSLLRTADGLGVDKVFLTGYTPYPIMKKDERLPHIAKNADRMITKTALGAEQSVDWAHHQRIEDVLGNLRSNSYSIIALEQHKDSISLPMFHPEDKTALIVGREVEGIEPEILALADMTVEIPMLGQKESFNVTQAAAIALYHLRFIKV